MSPERAARLALRLVIASYAIGVAAASIGLAIDRLDPAFAILLGGALVTFVLDTVAMILGNKARTGAADWDPATRTKGTWAVWLGIVGYLGSGVLFLLSVGAVRSV